MKIAVEINPFHARLNHPAIHDFLEDVGKKTQAIMVQQAAAKKTGRVYVVKGLGEYTASAPGEFPANKFGHLRRSYRVETSSDSVTIGTDMLVYPAYLRAGTHKMAARLFLKEALGFAMDQEHFKRPFVEFNR